MSKRTDNSPDNTFVTELDRMRTDLDTLKAAQKVGARNIVSYINMTAGAYDKAITLTSPSSTLASFSVFFTATRQAYCDAELSFRVYMDTMTNEINPRTTAWPSIGNTTPHTLPGSGGMVYQYDFNLWMQVSGTHTYYMKFMVTATDQGVITHT
jgi:hypothetical protein